MDPVVKEIKKRLKKEKSDYLRVRRGRGISSCWISIHRPNPSEMLSAEEGKAICRIFGEKEEEQRSNVYVIRTNVAEMKLGLREKKPVCEICGRVFEKEEYVRTCELSH